MSDLLKSQKINEYIRMLIKEQDFSIDNLFLNEEYFYYILNKIKDLIISKIEKDKNENENQFNIQKNIINMRNINYGIINKILRLINRCKNQNHQNFYLNSSLNELHIEITDPNLEPILLFSFLFIYINKFLSISKINIKIMYFNNILNEIIILQFLLYSKNVKKISFYYQFSYLFDFLFLKKDLINIKFINHKFKFSELASSIKYNKNLFSLTLKDCYLVEENDEIIKSEINNISLINIQKFKFKSTSKYLPSKKYLNKNQFYEFIRLSHLRDFSKFIIHEAKEEIDDNIPNSYKLLNKRTNINPSKNKIELYFKFKQFHYFEFLNLNSYSDIDIGTLDYCTFQNLINFTKNNKKIKNLICRFNDNLNDINEGFFSFLKEKNLSIKKLVLLNLKLNDSVMNKLLLLLSFNSCIETFIISPFHSIISNEKKNFVFSFNPEYYFLDFEKIIHIIFLLKKHPFLKQLYQKKVIINKILKFLFSKSSKKIYIETNNCIYSHGKTEYEFISKNY